METGEPKKTFIEKFANFVKSTPWSKIQLFIAGLIGFAFMLQYIIVYYALLFKKKLSHFPNTEDYDDIARKDAQMMVVRVMDMNPFSSDTSYAWLVYVALACAILCVLAFVLFFVKLLTETTSPEERESKSMKDLLIKIKLSFERIEKQYNELKQNGKHEQYENEFENVKKRVNYTSTNLTEELKTLNTLINKNDESKAQEPRSEPVKLLNDLNALYTKMKPKKFEFPLFNKKEEARAKYASKATEDVASKAAEDAATEAASKVATEGGHSSRSKLEQKGGETSTPNYILLIPILLIGLFLMFSGLMTIVSFRKKIGDIKKLSNDSEYEAIIKDNIPKNQEYLEALKDFALGSPKVNPYSWPPRSKISTSFDPDNEEDVIEMVRIIFLYRLSSHFVQNIAIIEAESKLYAALSLLKKRANELASIADNIGQFFGVMATDYVTDMVPLRRFTADIPYDDISALSELFQCSNNECPDGELSFSEMYRKNAEEINNKLDDISVNLSNLVNSSSNTLRLASQYKIASDYIYIFSILNVVIPLCILLILALCAFFMVTNNKIRIPLVLVVLVLIILPFVIRHFVDY